MLRTAIVAAFLLAASAPAFAQTNAPTPGMDDARQQFRQACRADIQSLCGDTERGQARRQCLKDNQSKLSQPCKDARAKMRAVRQASRAQ